MSAPAPQPRLARVAAAIGEPTRARVLARLLDGQLYAAGELARDAGVAPATMSAHLRLLVDEGLVRARAQGRHRYFGLADADVAHALEALLQVADGMPPNAARWAQPAMRGLRHARSCYGHLAGTLGVRLHDALLARCWVCAHGADGGYALTTDGVTGLQDLGLKGLEPSAMQHDRALPGPRRSARAGALYDCVDWSERRDHFAGPVAQALLDGFLEAGWLRRRDGSRELGVTAQGTRMLVETLCSP